MTTYLRNECGPYRDGAHKALPHLSRLATNVRIEERDEGAYVIFDLPEGAPVWSTPRPFVPTRSVRAEDLKVGDVIDTWFGQQRITAIEPYCGPLDDIVFAIARLAPGPGKGLSLCRNDWLEVVT